MHDSRAEVGPPDHHLHDDHLHDAYPHNAHPHDRDDPHEAPIAIDCATCDVRGLACGDCVVTVLLGTPPAWLDDEEQRALGVLAESGLVPPLRLVSSHEPSDVGHCKTSAGGHGQAPADGCLEAEVREVSTTARRATYRVRDTG